MTAQLLKVPSAKAYSTAATTNAQKRPSRTGRGASAVSLPPSSVGKPTKAPAAITATQSASSRSGNPIHASRAMNGATSTGPIARPAPSSECSATTAVSDASGKKSAG